MLTFDNEIAHWTQSFDFPYCFSFLVPIHFQVSFTRVFILDFLDLFKHSKNLSVNNFSLRPQAFQQAILVAQSLTINKVIGPLYLFLCVFMMAASMSSYWVSLKNSSSFSYSVASQTKRVIDYLHLKILHRDFCYSQSSFQVNQSDICYMDQKLSQYLGSLKVIKICYIFPQGTIKTNQSSLNIDNYSSIAKFVMFYSNIHSFLFKISNSNNPYYNS